MRRPPERRQPPPTTPRPRRSGGPRPLLADGVEVCLFDLDGVLTDTAAAHASAWKDMFDAYLLDRAGRTGEPFRPFELPTDYVAFVDGKLRQDGVRSFLSSRGITLPDGEPADPPEADTVHGLGSRKNELVLRVIRDRGVTVFDGSVGYVEAVRDAGIPRAVVSASKNCAEVLRAANLGDLFDVRVDGLTAEALGLAGKPAPDMFAEAARELGVDAGRAAVFEDAEAGVAAGLAGGFGWVVGIDRTGHAAELLEHGADVVVEDLSQLLEPA